MKGKVNFIAGLLLGIILVTGTGAAATEAVTATRTTTPFYVDGVPVTMAAYNINGNNYVMLRDIGAAVGFNVYWDGNVQIDSSAPYTGKPTVPAVPEADLESVRLEMIKLINETRRDHGAPMLATDQHALATNGKVSTLPIRIASQFGGFTLRCGIFLTRAAVHKMLKDSI